MPASSRRLTACSRIWLLLAAMPLVVRAEPPAPPTAELELPLHELIDQEIAASWEASGVVGVGRSSDAEFIRRVTLDLTGMIPRADRVRAFLDDRNPAKRQALIDELLASPEHVRRQAQLLDVMLMERREANRVPQAEWHEYLRQSVAENKPWDVLVREILISDGETTAPRAAARFYLDRDGDAHLLARDVGRIFLGRDMQCAQCHDHPLVSDYYQRDYHGLLAFFNRSYLFEAKDKPTVIAEKAEGEASFNSVFVKDDADQVAAPHLPGQPPIDEPALPEAERYVVAPAKDVRPVPKFSRRAALAEALPRCDTPGFARNIVNRLWAQLMGRGLVHPLDFDHSDNPPSHPQLLAQLTERFVARRCDMRYLLREIALSQAYQRSSQWPLETERPPPEAYAVAPLRPLEPEQLAVSLQQATGQADIQAIALGGGCSEAALFGKLSEGGVEIVRNFAGPPGQTALPFQATLAQTLLLSNGGALQNWLAPRPGNLTYRLASRSKPAELIDELYLSVVSRRPTPEEAAEIEKFLEPRVVDRAQALQELVWALIASSEFRFNH